MLLFFLLAVSMACNFIPIIVLPFAYKSIPDNIPALVDIWGNPVVTIGKSYISIFRLPLMGLLLTALCIVMYTIKISGENGQTNKMMWAIVAFIGALKMGITSLEVLFYENAMAISNFRICIFVLVLTGVIILICGVIKMYKFNLPTAEYKSEIAKNKMKIIGILCSYVIIVLIPLFIK